MCDCVRFSVRERKKRGQVIGLPPRSEGLLSSPKNETNDYPNEQQYDGFPGQPYRLLEKGNQLSHW